MQHLLFAFITSAGIAVAFRAPLRVIATSGATGFLGFAAYQLVRHLGRPEALAVFVGALVIGIAGELFARLLREPALCFMVPGLFPLVPGIYAYNGMLHLAEGELAAAGHELTQTIIYASALAAGLALPPPIWRRIDRQIRRGKE